MFTIFKNVLICKKFFIPQEPHLPTQLGHYELCVSGDNKLFKEF